MKKFKDEKKETKWKELTLCLNYTASLNEKEAAPMIKKREPEREEIDRYTALWSKRKI